MRGWPTPIPRSRWWRHDRTARSWRAGPRGGPGAPGRAEARVAGRHQQPAPDRGRGSARRRAAHRLDEGGPTRRSVGSMEVGHTVHSRHTSGKSEVMPEVIAGLEIPETAAVAEATRLIQETTSPLIYHHSRRVFFFGLIHAHKLGVQPDPELLCAGVAHHSWSDQPRLARLSDRPHPAQSRGDAPRSRASAAG